MYKYPDVDDKNLTANVINKDWEDGGLEEQYLNECIKSIPIAKRDFLLDAGCGQGRLLHAITPCFKRIIAIDPDVARLEKAKMRSEELCRDLVDKNTDSKSFLGSIDFFVSTIQDFEAQCMFDCVLCSHIIQHLHTKDVGPFLKIIHSIIKKNGYLILSTTNLPKDEDEFSMTNTLTNDCSLVAEKGFNRCVTVNNHFLPTRYFAESTLRKLLTDAGFKLLWLKKYHGFPKTRGDNFVFATAI